MTTRTTEVKQRLDWHQWPSRARERAGRARPVARRVRETRPSGMSISTFLGSLVRLDIGPTGRHAAYTKSMYVTEQHTQNRCAYDLRVFLCVQTRTLSTVPKAAAIS